MSTMPSRNSYFQYKKDTNELLAWIVSTAARFPSPERPVLPSSNTLKVSTLLLLAQYVATRLSAIPSRVYSLFRSAISARRNTYVWYQTLVAQNQDPEILVANERHKVFITALEKAFDALGGKNWDTQQAEEKKERKEKRVGEEKEEESEAEDEEDVFLNRFSGLTVDNLAEDIEDGAKESGEEEDTAKAMHTRHNNRGKKGKGAKGKNKAKAKKPHATPEVPVEDQFNVSFEDYQLVDDEGSEHSISDLRIAVWCFFREIWSMQHWLEEVWIEVLGGKTPASVAGVLSNVLIARVKELEHEIAKEFPAIVSMDEIVRIYTGGSMDKVIGGIKFLEADPSEGALDIKTGDHLSQSKINWKEIPDAEIRRRLMVPAYEALHSFITDYRKNRNGKPTKGMQADIKNWDPYWKFGKAPQEDREKWCSQFALKWLYDLVNTYSLPLLEKAERQKLKPETLDWTPKGRTYPLENGAGGKRMLSGLISFAAEITVMAMQRTSAPIRILPHQVFTLNLAIDTMEMARYPIDAVREGTVIPMDPRNPTAVLPEDFESNAAYVDLMRFKGRERNGLKSGLENLRRYIGRDAMDDNNPKRMVTLGMPVLDDAEAVLRTFGEPKLGQVANAPISQFKDTLPNGLWAYCPLLCATALAEGVVIMADYGMEILDRGGYLLSILHLYNFVRKMDHLKEGVMIWDTLTTMFKDAAFTGGELPTDNFPLAYMTVVGVKLADMAVDPTKRRLGKKGTLDAIVHPGIKKYIFRGPKARGLVKVLMDNEWIPDRIPDEEVPLKSGIGHRRLLNLVDSKASKLRTGSVLLKRYLAAGTPPSRFTSEQWIKDVSGLVINPVSYYHCIEEDAASDIIGLTAPYCGINWFELAGWLMIMTNRCGMAILNTREGYDIHRSGRAGTQQAENHEHNLLIATQSWIDAGCPKDKCNTEVFKAIARQMEMDVPKPGLAQFAYWFHLRPDKSMIWNVVGEDAPNNASNNALSPPL